MKRKNVLTLFFLILIIFSNISFAGDVYIDNIKIYFNITPESIDENTLVPLEQMTEHYPMEIIELPEDKLFIYYTNNYLMLNLNRHNAEMNNTGVFLKNPPVKINGHYLIPIGIISKLLNVNFTINNPDFKLPKPIIKNKIKVQLLLEKNIYYRNEVMTINLLVSNIGDKKEVLYFNSGQRYDILIKNKKGQIISKWSQGKFFTQSIGKLTLEAGESKLYRVSLDSKNIFSGTYELYGLITSTQKITSQAVEILIK